MCCVSEIYCRQWEVKIISLDYGSSVGFNQYLNTTGTNSQREQTCGKSEGYDLAVAGVMMQLDPESDSVVGHFPSSKPGKTNSVGCPLCGKLFSAYGSMLDHKAAIHDNVSYICICGKTYKYKPGLRRHKQTCQIAKLSKQSSIND